MSQFKPDFYIIPRQIANSDGLQPTDWKLYAVIYWLKSLKQGICKASNQTLADIVGCSENSISNGLNRLLKEGYIDCKYKDEAKRHRERIIPLVTYSRSTRRLDHTNRSSIDHTNRSQKKYYKESNNIKKEKKGKEKNIKKRKKEVNEISPYYQQKIKSNSRLTDKARKKIKTRLKEFSLKELKEAMDNFSEDDWWMDNNSHRGMAWFFHSDDRVDQFLNLEPQKQGPQTVEIS